MPQLAQRLGFDLANSFTGYIELFANLFERVVGIHVDAKAHPQYFRFARCKASEHRVRGFLEARGRCRVDGRVYCRILNEVTQVRILIVTNRRFHRNGFLRDFQHFANFVLGHFHALGEFIGQRFAAHFLQHLPGDAVQFVDRLDHVHRDADRPRLVRNRTCNRLANPPSGVG